ncbi:MAG: electron transfer flavoprotein subunit alpha/FixB family protein, partial [Candidatus Hodarchaeota archaeon]
MWIVAEIKDGNVRNVSYELLGKARELAEHLNQKACVLLLGDNVKRFIEEFTSRGANKIYIAEHEALKDYYTETYSAVITGIISRYNPNIVLYPATINGRDLAPRVAATLELGLTADCTGLSIRDGL